MAQAGGFGSLLGAPVWKLAGALGSVYRRGSPDIRGIAQPGSAAVLGTAGRWFESSCPDQSRAALAKRPASGRQWPGIHAVQPPLRAKSAKPHRTSACRHRQIRVGDFSAQCPNGRRQAMHIPLARRCVLPGALVSSRRTSRAEMARKARLSGCRWRLEAALVRPCSRLARKGPRARRGADAHIAISSLSPPAIQLFPNVRSSAKFSLKISLRRNGAFVLKSRTF